MSYLVRQDTSGDDILSITEADRDIILEIMENRLEQYAQAMIKDMYNDLEAGNEVFLNGVIYTITEKADITSVDKLTPISELE